MKKILCVVLMLLVVFSCGANVARGEDLESELDALAEELTADINELGDQELILLREMLRGLNTYVDMRICAKLAGSEINGHSFEKISTGIYYGGSDLSAGRYRIYICEVDESTWEALVCETYAETADLLIMDSVESYRTGGNAARRMKAGDSTQIELKENGVLVVIGGWGYAERIGD